MDIEFNALVRNDTWDLLPPKPSHNLVDNKWVFHIKRHADGRAERFKAQLVAKRYHHHMV
jgi:hypothetical protein